jgi:pimeloyl-ACP methyl ester carboxylesterase
MAQIERAFVTIREGQVHLRRSVGSPGSRPVWMVHASPSSSWSLSALVAGLGDSRPAIAPDTLGNGDSVAPTVDTPDIAYYANAALRTMDALGIAEADLYGSHTGAHIVVEMALAQPQRFGRMILDGIGMFTPAQKTEYLGQYAPAITPDFFGTQFHWAWHFVRDQAWFFPYFKRDVAHLRGTDAPSADVLHMLTLDVLKGIRSYHKAYRAAFAHPDRERLPLLTIPTLVMADADDPLQGGVVEAARLLPGALSTIHRWPAGNDRGATKVALLARFLDTGQIS